MARVRPLKRCEDRVSPPGEFPLGPLASLAAGKLLKFLRNLTLHARTSHKGFPLKCFFALGNKVRSCAEMKVKLAPALHNKNFQSRHFLLNLYSSRTTRTLKNDLGVIFFLILNTGRAKTVFRGTNTFSFSFKALGTVLGSRCRVFHMFILQKCDPLHHKRNKGVMF